MAQFYSQQVINTDINTAWDFFANPHNLKIVSLPGSGFEVLNQIEGQICKNMIVVHRIYPFPFIKGKWVSKILEVNHPTFFIDQMQKGPFAYWKHKHSLETVDQGVLVKDEIEFRLPLGILGSMIEFIVRAKIKKSFEYRIHRLDQIFNNRD